jgi:hypothetical protein
MQEKKQAPIRTTQWVEESVFLAFQKTAKTRPDFEVLVREEGRDGNLVAVELSFSHVGRYVFTKRLISFVVHAMKDNYKQTVTTSEPVPVPA